MGEPDEDLAGMGATPRGPSFMPSGPPIEPQRHRPEPPYAHPGPPGPPRTLRPTVISILVIALVAVVVAGASFVAYWGDTHVAAPTRARVTAPPPYSTAPDRIDFVTEDGSGQLIMRTRWWVREGKVPPASGHYLRLEVELVCTQGEVDYDPYLFQAFDKSGQLYDMAADGAGGGVLTVGTLTEGQRIRGLIAFDIPRGDVTLLMSDDSANTVTALRVPD